MSVHVPAYTFGGLTRPALTLDDDGNIVFTDDLTAFVAAYGIKALSIGLPSGVGGAPPPATPPSTTTVPPITTTPTSPPTTPPVVTPPVVTPPADTAPSAGTGTIVPAFTFLGITRPELHLDSTGHILLDPVAAAFAALYGLKALYLGLPPSTPFPPIPVVSVSTPVDVNAAANSVAEGAAVNSAVGVTVSAISLSGFGVSYALTADSSGGGFKVDASTGVVSIADPAKIDFETSGGAHAHSITVRASDGIFTSSQNFTIAVADIAPSTPVDVNNAGNTIAEGAAVNSLVGVTASSADINGPAVTYAISADSSGGGFKVDAASGVVSVADPSRIDYESSGAGHSYSITVQASDGTLTSSQSFTIGVTNVAPSTPVDANAAADSVPEGAAVNTAVGVTASSTDLSGPAVTYSLTADSSNGGFKIDPATGVISVADPSKFDYESSGPSHAFSVTVQASDGALTSSQNFTIAVANVAPTAAIDANATGNSVVEGAAVNTLVGITASSSDPNGPAVTYSLIADSSGGGFRIDASTGVVTVADSTKIDFESAAGHSYAITVQSSDGQGGLSTQTFAIGVTDVAPTQPTDTVGPAGGTVAEGSTIGTLVGIKLAATDINGAPLTYAFADIGGGVLGDAGGRFAINPTTGDVYVSAAGVATIDFETAPSHAYTVTVQASDGTLLSSPQSFTIAVTNVAPSTPSDGDVNVANSVLEGAATGTYTGLTAASTDPGSASSQVTYSLTDDAGGRFTINAVTGVVNIGNASLIDYETAAGHAYSITVQASDNAGVGNVLTSSQTFSIAVANAPPSTPADSDAVNTNRVTEGVASGVYTGLTAQSVDPNSPSSQVTYSLTDDAGGRFTIDSVTGRVLTGSNAGLIDFETSGGTSVVNGSYNITVQASDGQGGASTQTLAIGVLDAPPASWVDANGAPNTISENAATSSGIGITAHAVDPNGGTVHYSLVGGTAPVGAFAIDEFSGVISVLDGSLIDYETAAGHAYTLNVRGADDSGSATTQLFTVGVSDLAPSLPINTLGGNGSVVEGAGASTVVGITALSTDPADPAGGSVVQYSLSNDAGGLFTINSTTGEVSVTALGAGVNGIDYESTASAGHKYIITVNATDGTLSVSQDFTIGVTNAPPSTPVDADAAANSVQFNAANGAAVGITLSATDPNGGAVSYTLTGDTSIGGFSVDANGVVRVANTTLLAPATSYTITAVAADASNAQSAPQTFSIFVANNNLNVDLDANDSSTATGNNYLASFTEQGSAIAISDSDTVLTNTGNPAVTTATSATIVLTNAQAGDSLTIAGVLPGGITQTTTAGAGIITIVLSGATSYANYAAALHQIQFSAAGDAPNTTPRVVDVTVTDQTGTSPAAHATINVVAVNDAPVLTLGPAGGVSYTENAAATPLFSTGSLVDPDVPANFAGGSYTVAITNNVDPGGGDQIVLLGSSGFSTSGSSVLFGGVSIGAITGLGTASVSVSLNAAATPAVVNQLIDAFGYQSASENPSAALRTVSLTFNDGGHTGTGNALDSNTVTETVTVTPVNDAPVAQGAVVNGTEDTPISGNVPVATDVDSPSLTYNLVGNNGGAQHGTVSITNSATGAYTYTPDANYSGPDSFSFVANDGSPTNNISSAATISITLAAVNDAPVLTSTTLAAVAEDTTNPPGQSIASLLSGHVTDPDANASLQGIAISGNAAAASEGVWQYFDGTTWIGIDTTVSQSSALLLSATTLVRFVPAPDYNGTPGALSLYGIDDTFNGTFTISGSPQTIDLSVAATHGGATPVSNVATTIGTSILAVNDAPVADSVTAPIAGTEDTVINGTAVAHDIDSPTLTYSLVGNNGGAQHGTVTFTNATTGAYTYTPNANYNGADSFSFKANDGNLDSNTATISINLAAVNDAPVLTAATLAAITEDATSVPGATIGSLFAGHVTDPDARASLLGVAVSANTADAVTQGAWQYSTDSGATWTAIGAVSSTIALLLSAASLVRFVPVADYNGTPPTLSLYGIDDTFDTVNNPFTSSVGGRQTFDVSATHGGATPVSDIATTLGASVTEMNDAPVPATHLLSSVAEDSGVRVIQFTDLTATDSRGAANESGQTLTITSVSNAVGGSVTITGGHIAFTPDANYNGTASFDYGITDNGTTNGAPDPLSATGHVSFAVTEVNDAPVAQADVLSSIPTSATPAVRIISFAALTGNDSAGPANESAQTLTVTAVSNALGGSVAINNGQIEFTPTANFAGTASFDYMVTDNGTTTGVNDFKTATGHVSFTISDIALDLDANDSTTTGDNFKVVVAGTPTAVVPIADVDTLINYPGATPKLTSATVTIAGGFVSGEDILAFTGNPSTMGDITAAAFNTSTGVLSLTSAAGATVAQWQAALEAVTYHDALTTPTSTADRTITVVVNDVATASNTAITTVRFDANQAPTANADPLSAVAEDSGVRVISFATLTGNDSPGPAAESGQTLTITSVLNAVGGTVAITSGHIEFTPTLNFNGQASFDYVITDNGFSYGDSDPRSATGHVTFTVTPVNDAPVLTAVTLTTIAEDTPSAAGDTIGTLFTGHSTDPDSGSSLLGIAVSGNTANAATQGVWQYLLGATWTDIGAVSSTTALLLDASTAIRFNPAANYNGTPPALSVFGVDDSFAGTFTSSVGGRQTIDVSTTHGGATPVSDVATTISASVTAVNDAPVLTPATLAAVLEDPASPSGQTVADLFAGHVTDPDAGASLHGIAVSGNAANPATEGAWQYSIDSGANWTAIGAVTTTTALLLDASTLVRFVPVANYNGTPGSLSVYGIDDSFTGTFTSTNGLQTLDVSATHGGATAISDQPTTLGSSITAVNDAPVLTATTLTSVAEDTANPAGQTVAAVFAGHVADPDAGASLAGIAVVGNTANPATEGAWQYSTDSGASWFNVGTHTTANAILLNAASLIRFVPVADYNGTPPALSIYGIDNSFAGTFTGGGVIQTLDVSTTHGGATAVSDVAVNLGTSVTEVNDAPVANPDVLGSVAEDSGERTISFDTLLANDSRGPANESGQTLTITAVSNPVGGAVTIDTVNRLIKFTPAANFNGMASFNYTLPDNGTTAGNADFKTATGLVSFTVTPVNDPPVLDLDSTDGAVQTGYTTTASSFAAGVAVIGSNVAISDVDNTTLASATVTLTIGDASDTLAISGSLPGGINATVTSGANTRTVTLTGVASLATYQAALQHVVFSTTDANATPADRSVSIVVNDGADPSIAAVSTIHVISNTPPVANPKAGTASEAGGVNNGTAGTAATGNVITDATADTDAQDATSALVASAVAVHGGATGTIGQSLNGLYGTLLLNANGSYSYAVDNTNATVQALRTSGQTLSDIFDYTIKDTGNLTTTATLTITITGTDDAPVAVADAGSVTEAGGLNNATSGNNPTPTGNVLTNDTDVDSVANGELLVVAGVAANSVAGPLASGAGGPVAGAHGSVTIASSGSYTYTVTETDAAVQALRTFAQTLTDTFSYTLKDAAGATSTTQLTVTIHGQNDAPVAVADTSASPGAVAATEAGGTNNSGGSNATGNVLTNDTDPDSAANGETKVVQGVENSGNGHTTADVVTTGVATPITGDHGTLTLNANGSYSYAVNNSDSAVQALNVNQTTTDTFIYTMHDTAGVTSTSTLTVTINGANDAPVATNLGSTASPAYTAFDGVAVTVNAGSGLRTGASDVDNATTTLNAVKDTNPGHGSVTVNTDGSFTYTSTAGYFGLDSFTYHVTDPGNLSSGSATAYISVLPSVAYINNNYTGTVSGTLGSLTNPFNSIAAFNAQNDAAHHFDIVYLERGTGTYTAATGITLLAGQSLLGQGVDATYTRGDNGQTVLLNDFSNTASDIATISVSSGNAVTLSTGNTIQGINIANTGSGVGVIDNGGSVGTLTLAGVKITTTSGAGLSLTHGGTVTAAATTTTANDGVVDVNSITSGTGTALNVQNTTIGASGLIFHDISANGGTNGIVLNTTGSSGGLTVTGDGTTGGSGGTIQNTDQGAVLTSTSNVSLANMNFTNANTGEGAVNNIDNATFNSGAKAAINLSSVSGATFTNLNVNGNGGAGGVQFGINGQNVSNLTIANSTVTGFGDEVTEGDVALYNLTGTSAFTNSNFSFKTGDTTGGENLVKIVNDSGTLTLNVTGSTFSNTRDSQYGSSGLDITTVSNATLNLNVSKSSFLNLKSGGIDTIARNTSTQNVNISNGGVNGNGNIFDPQAATGRAIGLSAQDTAHLNFNINNNAKLYGAGGPIVNIFTINSAVATGRIDNNSDIRGVVATATGGVSVNTADNSQGIVEIVGNTISNVYGIGVTGIANGTSSLDLTIASNTIGVTNNGQTGSAFRGATAAVFVSSTDTANAYVNIKNNIVTTDGTPFNNNDNGVATFGEGKTSHLYFENFQAGANTSNLVRANATWNGNGNTNSNTPGGPSVYVQDGSGAAAYAGIPGGHNGGHVATPNNPTALLSATGGVASASVTPGETHLIQAQLDGIVAVAIAHWAAAGASAAQIATLQSVSYDVGDLMSGWLGASTPGHVTISTNADGYGWFIDPTPNDNSEFAHAVSPTHLVADPISAAAGHIDLLTTVLHEMGEQLGLDDQFAPESSDNLQYVQLAAGERRLPDAVNAARAVETALPTSAQALPGTPIVVGATGNDTLDAGQVDAHNDGVILFGGTGADTFVFGAGVQVGTSAQVTQVADYNAAQGDRFDFSGLTQIVHGPDFTDATTVRAIEDSSGAFATLQINTNAMGLKAGPTWAAIAQLDGAHAGDAVDIVLASAATAHLAHIHVDLLV